MPMRVAVPLPGVCRMRMAFVPFVVAVSFCGELGADGGGREAAVEDATDADQGVGEGSYVITRALDDNDLEA